VYSAGVGLHTMHSWSVQAENRKLGEVHASLERQLSKARLPLELVRTSRCAAESIVRAE
jgi:hypothetical protein